MKSTLSERFAANVNVAGPDECWEWQGRAHHKFGYGQITACADGLRRTLYAHRLAYELAHGPIPDGMVVMHSCDNPPCCNPNHLSTGTIADNNADAKRKGRFPTKTHCIRGHEFTPENTLIRRGKRNCRSCSKMSRRERLGLDPPPPRTHCKHGHETTTENTYVLPDGERACRECGNRRNREMRARLRAAKVGLQ